ncbi:MAG: Medium-chain fatty-acid--CoA ligase [Steroidobacteraceae bacterium]|nr:Medium-chain fatty-acid--CoA ligase [Steroidobacteraceae bacterium]
MERAEIAADQSMLRAKWCHLGYYGGNSIAEWLREGVRKFPGVESIYYVDRRPRHTTNLELYQASIKIASALARLGVRSGDVVAVQLPTWYETTVLYLALVHLGAIALPIVSIYGSAEVEFILRESKAKLYFSPASWRKVDYLQRHATLRSLPHLEDIVIVGGGAPTGSRSWEHLEASATTCFEPTVTDPDSVSLLIYTSGTTSAPKGVQHTHHGLLHEWGRPSYRNRGMYLANLPAGHYTGYGFMFRPSIYGAPMVFQDQWDAQFAAELVQRHRVKAGGGTPIFLFSLLEMAEKYHFDISSLESFGLGAESVAPTTVQLADSHGFPGARVYGSTEHPTVTSLDPEAPFERRAYTDGRVDEGNEVRIVDEKDRDVSLGGEGEILTRGPEMFAGYLDPELNCEAFVRGGWFRSGDIGRLDAEGYLTITDRKKDIIIRGGENISSKEVEDALCRHPAVRAAAAIAMPDKSYGEKVCAFVELRGNSSLTLGEVQKHFVHLGLARQKTPERLEVISELPRNSSGKIKKAELRAIVREAASPIESPHCATSAESDRHATRGK